VQDVIIRYAIKERTCRLNRDPKLVGAVARLAHSVGRPVWTGCNSSQPRASGGIDEYVPVLPVPAKITT
jgi:hypothetical protein